MHLTVDVIWALKTQAQNSQNCFRWNFKKDVELSLKIVTTYCAVALAGKFKKWSKNLGSVLTSYVLFRSGNCPAKS